MLPSNITVEQLEKARSARSLEELAAMAKAEGIEATDEELGQLWCRLSEQKEIVELADDELENVAGGCGADTTRYGKYPVRDSGWGPCEEMLRGFNPQIGWVCGNCQHFKYIPEPYKLEYEHDGYCTR